MTNKLAERVENSAAAAKTGQPTVFDLLKNQQTEIERALPKHMDSDRFARIAMTQLRRTPKLMQCEPMSLIGAVMRLAQVGLEPDGRNAHLVPFGKECTPVIDYRGYMELARRSGQVADIYAEAVYENDEFDHVLGLHRDIIHRPTSGQRGKLTHTYAVCNFKDGGHAFIVLTEEDVMKRKAESKTANRSDSMWVEWPEKAWCKTAVRALAAFMPYSPEMQLAENTDRAIESGKDFLSIDEIGDEADAVIDAELIEEASP